MRPSISSCLLGRKRAGAQQGNPKREEDISESHGLVFFSRESVGHISPDTCLNDDDNRDEHPGDDDSFSD